MIDFTKKIKNSNKFRLAAITFKETGSYCAYPIGTTEYVQYWEEEKKRCLDGYTAEDGDYITGYNYFYLNYCPIERIVYEEKTDRFGNTKKVRVRKVDFPDFYDYDYYYFQALQEAEDKGKHMCVLKSRRKGFSYKNASLTCRNYYLIPNSKSYIYASDETFLLGDGTMSKVNMYMSFIDKNTAFAKKRTINKALHKRSGFFTKDEYGNEIEMGYKSEIIAKSLKDDPSRVRGKAGKLIIFEEAGSFSELGAAWSIARPSVEQDGIAFGMLLAFGCVCAGSRVWTADGNCVNIEDLTIEDGIMGWDTYQAFPQNISNINPPALKECLKITTNTGRSIKCSIDHPLLWSTPGKTRRVPDKRKEDEYMKSWLWHRADLCKVGDHVGIINEIPFFGNKRMWEPRFVGWLIGDGSYGKDKTPRLSNCDQDILEYTETKFDTVSEKSYITKEGKQYKELRIKGICLKLRELGIYGQTKDKKRLPINIHTYDKYTLTELIGGLFDTDGYVSVRKDGSVRIILTQCQKEILLLVQEVLLHFGVHCCVRHIKSDNKEHYSNGRLIKSKNGEWRLEINDVTSVSKFADNVELTVKYKQAALDLIYVYAQSHLAKHRKYVNGVHIERIVKIESIGLQTIYNLTAKEQHNYIVNGIITHNTGGDTKGNNFTTLKDMFYHPDGYNCLAFNNIWDENATEKCGFFCPQYTNLANIDDNGNRLYMDEDGNTKKKEALEYIMSLRREVINNASNSQTVDRYVAENCITPNEAILNFNGNIFPKKELQLHLASIRTNKQLQNHKQVGDLVFTEANELKWIPKKTGDITRYPLEKDDDPTGSIVIWEHPMQDAPFGLYIAGIDSYDYDDSSTTSLGSCLIYKRFQNFESYSDIIVAEYTGRPKTAEDFYENVRKLLLYYNARAMYENQNKGIFVYFTNKHCDYLLADQPDIINDIVGNSKVQRKKGCHMNKQIKQWGEGLIKDWLNGLNSAGKKNLYNILSEPLLEELIAYNDNVNTDRCLTKGTLITTDKGDIPIEEISLQDKVLTDKGNYKSVIWLDNHIHCGNVVTLKCSGDYLKLTCTDNHPILVKYTDKKTHKFRDLNKLTTDFLRADLLKYKHQFTLLPKRNILNKPRTLDDRMLYLLGWIMGNGYCHHSSNEITITYQLDQLKCVEQCKQIIKNFDNSAPCKLSKDKFSNCYRLTIYSKKLHELALKFGCIPHNKEIALDVYNNHTDLIPFVLGLLEANGHQKYNANYDGHIRNAIEISSIYESLLRQCRLILLDNGIYSTIRELKPKYGKRLVNLQINGEYVHKLLSYYTFDNETATSPIFSYKFKQTPFKKSKHVAQQDEYGFWVPIKLLCAKEIKETVYNIEVEEDHTYVSNGIVTHNCMAFMQIMIYRELLYNVVVKEKEKENKSRMLFDGPIFAQNWFDDPQTNSYDDNVYTF